MKIDTFAEGTEAHFFAQESCSTHRFLVWQHRILYCPTENLWVEFDSCEKNEPLWFLYTIEPSHILEIKLLKALLVGLCLSAHIQGLFLNIEKIHAICNQWHFLSFEIIWSYLFSENEWCLNLEKSLHIEFGLIETSKPGKNHAPDVINSIHEK